MELVAGTQIPFDNHVTYEVISPIGAGGQGAVYKVKNLSDNQLYALKVLVDKDEARKEMKRRNIRLLIEEQADQAAFKEGRANNINHTFPLSSCTYNGETLYVMELACGHTLDHMIDEDNAIIQKMSVEDKLKLVRQIALSIKIINRSIGGCYTDINWGNFIVDRGNGWLYVVDCENVASNTDIQDGKFSFVMGTGFFMAPEVAFGLANAGMNADRYALANLIFRILTNNVLPSPYHGEIMYSSAACQNMLDVKDLVDDDDIDDGWSVFIFDERDRRNGIDSLYASADSSQPKLQKKRREFDAVIKIWNALDDRLKTLFKRAFRNPLEESAYMNRPSPLDWVNAIDGIFSGRPVAPLPASQHSVGSGAAGQTFAPSGRRTGGGIGLGAYEDFVPSGAGSPGSSALGPLDDFSPAGGNGGSSPMDQYEDFVPAGAKKKQNP